MKINYLILAHKDPEQLELLAKTLKSEKSNIYIHIDGNSDKQIFQNNTYLAENCKFVQNNIKIRRGGFSIVQGTINGLKEIEENGLDDKDYIIVLSGQDFPVMSQEKLFDILTQADAKSFVEYRIQPNEEWNILNRVTKYHFHDLIVPNWLNNILEKFVGLFVNLKALNLRNQISCYIIQRIVNIFMPIKRFFIEECKLYRGSQRQVLSAKHVKYILSQLEKPEGKNIYDNFKYTAGPDELFFQTILLNSPHKDEIIDDLRRYIDWKKGPGLPRVLDMSDYENIKKSDKRFARKFELGESEELISQLISDFK